MGLEIALSSVTITKAELEPVVTWTTSTCHVWLNAEHRSFVAAYAPCIFGGKCVEAVQMLTHWHDFGGFLVTFQKLMFSVAEEPLYILVKQKKCFMFSHTEWCSFARDLMLWPATQFKFKQKSPMWLLACVLLSLFCICNFSVCFQNDFFIHFQSFFKDNWQKTSGWLWFYSSRM